MTLGKTLAEVQNLSTIEIDLWCIYFKQNPQGEERADNRAGIIAATIANYSGRMKKGSKPFGHKDFVLEYGTKKEKSAEHQQAIVRSLSPRKTKKKE